MEVPMTMHSKHHLTEPEDAAFAGNHEMMAGLVIGLFAIAGALLWYVYYS
jgi:hypothetical protein